MVCVLIVLSLFHGIAIHCSEALHYDPLFNA